MSRRKSYFANFPTSTLFLVLEQNVRELANLESKSDLMNGLLKERIKQVELVISVSKNIIVNRYLQDNISLSKIAKLIISSEGVKKSVYKEVFTLKILENNEIISLELLENAINELDIDELMVIIRNKENSIYKDLALKRYDKIIFDVEPDVYKELIMKKRLDWRG